MTSWPRATQKQLSPRQVLEQLARIEVDDKVRRSLINKQLEILRRNSGGYFHSEQTAKLKLGIAVTSLESGKWQRVAATVKPRSISSTPCSRRDSRRNDAGGHNIIDKCPPINNNSTFVPFSRSTLSCRTPPNGLVPMTDSSSLD